jgi:hypothetical protein
MPVAAVVITAIAGSYFLSQSFAATPTIGSVETVPAETDSVQAWPAPDGTQIAVFQSYGNDTYKWYVARLKGDSKPPYTDAISGPGSIHDLTIGPDSTAYFAVGNSTDAGGMLLRLKPGAASAEILKTFEVDPTTGRARRPQGVEFLGGKLYVNALSAASLGGCLDMLYVLDSNGAELKTLENPLGCGGSWQATPNMLTALDYNNARIAYFDPATLDMNARPMPYGNKFETAMGSDGSYAFKLGVKCDETRIARVGPHGEVYDHKLVDIFPTVLSTPPPGAPAGYPPVCQYWGHAILSDLKTVVAITDYDNNIHIGVIDEGGQISSGVEASTKQDFPHTTVTADGAGHFIVATPQKQDDCALDKAQYGVKSCARIQINVYNRSGLVTSSHIGGSWDNSFTQGAPISIKDGSLGVPVIVNLCRECYSIPKREVVQVAAPVKRQAWHDPAESQEILADTDGDGLPDKWELNGVMVTPEAADGTKLPPHFIDLPKMGAKHDKADIFVQLDWMKGYAKRVAPVGTSILEDDIEDLFKERITEGNFSDKLSPAALKKVADAFRNESTSFASVNGTKGINLHIDQGPESIMNFETGEKWGTLSRANELPMQSPFGAYVNNDPDNWYDWTAFDEIKNSKFTPTGRAPIFHYAISTFELGKTGTNTSGISRGSGSTAGTFSASDFILALGPYETLTLGPSETLVGNDLQQSLTFMHELGHNLGLRHGGQDDVNHKPNYISIMNYFFGNGLTNDGGTGIIDYSSQWNSPLDERSIDETSGIGSSNYFTWRRCAGWFSSDFYTVKDTDGPIDWNCNGKVTDTGVEYDVTLSNKSDGTKEHLESYDDWKNIVFNGGLIGKLDLAPDLPVITPSEMPLSRPMITISPELAYNFQGFFSPVNAFPRLNSASAGNTVPIKFSLGGDKGLSIFLDKYPAYRKVSCTNPTIPIANDKPVSAGQSALVYDAQSGQYIYNWRTDKSWKGTCREFAVMLKDGTRKTAVFQFK